MHLIVTYHYAPDSEIPIKNVILYRFLDSMNFIHIITKLCNDSHNIKDSHNYRTFKIRLTVIAFFDLSVWVEG